MTSAKSSTAEERFRMRRSQHASRLVPTSSSETADSESYLCGAVLRNEEEQVKKRQETGAQPKNKKRLPIHPSAILETFWLKAYTNPRKSLAHQITRQESLTNESLASQPRQYSNSSSHRLWYQFDRCVVSHCERSSQLYSYVLSLLISSFARLSL